MRSFCHLSVHVVSVASSMSALVFSQQHSAGSNVAVMAYHTYVYDMVTPMDEVYRF